MLNVSKLLWMKEKVLTIIMNEKRRTEVRLSFFLFIPTFVPW